MRRAFWIAVGLTALAVLGIWIARATEDARRRAARPALGPGPSGSDGAADPGPAPPPPPLEVPQPPRAPEAYVVELHADGSLFVVEQEQRFQGVAELVAELGDPAVRHLVRLRNAGAGVSREALDAAAAELGEVFRVFPQYDEPPKDDGG